MDLERCAGVWAVVGNARDIMESCKGEDGFMASITLEERVKALETELAEVKKQFAKERTAERVPWWEKIYGTFAESEEYDEAMRLGREWGESFRPNDDEAAPLMFILDTDHLSILERGSTKR